MVFESAGRAVLQIGKVETPYPVPLVKKGRRWRFDSSEGHEDLLSRCIGKTELSALDMMGAHVNAQREFYQDHNGDGILEYDQRFRSSSDKHDGRYWRCNPGEAPRPNAELVNAIRQEGYKPPEEGNMAVYRGCSFKILKAQGKDAPGGARAYGVDSKMIDGFALVAFPVRYGISGVLTFVVDLEGVVYHKDLGPKTVKLGRDMALFNPDKS